MTTTEPTAGNHFFPRIVGFDMPPAQEAGASDASAAMVVMLDESPAREWAVAFSRHSAKFRSDHQLSDLRLIGRNLTVMGDPDVLRGLSPQVNAMIHSVSRQCMDSRMKRASESVESEDIAKVDADKKAERLQDLKVIARIVGVPGMLEEITRTTGMRFAAIARVTEARWTACAVYDLIEFGLQPGQDLVLESTICNEIRQHGEMVQIDQASADPVFSSHPVPAIYGFESYISIPILRQDGSFFGTLCALDPAPSRLDEAAIAILKNFAGLIGQELEPEVEG